jgi:hypothetical protein
MIFTSLGILVAAGGFLIAGIVRSSIPLLVVSLIGTAAAAFILLATADLARRRAWESAGMPVAGGAAGVPPGTQPVVMYVPVGETAAVAAGTGGGNGSTGSPIPGYEVMTATQITKIIASGDLSRDQLDAVRRYEKAHGSRKTILDRVDRALSN